jgi:hypothetical protein
MKESGLTFHFDNQYFHRLSKLQTKKSSTISLGGCDFHFSLEEVCLIALKIVEFYHQNHTKFILLSEGSNESDQLISHMGAIQNLFTNTTEIEINQENERYFSLLADKFNNGVLQKSYQCIASK